jgi:hypothetical protein
MAASTAEPYALGSAASEKTIRLALWSACHGANRSWHDDMLQAARLKLWRMGSRWPMVWRYGGAHYRAALNAIRRGPPVLAPESEVIRTILAGDSPDDVERLAAGLAAEPEAPKRRRDGD